MKKLLFFSLVVLFFNTSAWAMIDNYAFTVIGKIIAISDKPVDDAEIKDEFLQNPYYIKLEILSIIPTEKDMWSWIGRYHVKGLVNINRILSKRDIERDRGFRSMYSTVSEEEVKIETVDPGDIIIGFFFSNEKEFHGHGYRIDNLLHISERFPNKTLEVFFLEHTKQIKKLFGSNNVASMINAIIVARENNLKVLAPLILKTLNQYYPKGKWEPREAWDLYDQGISAFKTWNFMEATGLLEKIVSDKENEQQIGVDFKNIQKDAKDAIQVLKEKNSERRH